MHVLAIKFSDKISHAIYISGVRCKKIKLTIEKEKWQNVLVEQKNSSSFLKNMISWYY